MLVLHIILLCCVILNGHLFAKKYSGYRFISCNTMFQPITRAQYVIIYVRATLCQETRYWKYRNSFILYWKKKKPQKTPWCLCHRGWIVIISLKLTHFDILVGLLDFPTNGVPHKQKSLFAKSKQLGGVSPTLWHF